MNSNIEKTAEASESETDLSFADFLDTLLQHIWLVLGVTFAVFLAGVLYVVFTAPVYRADALIQVETEGGGHLSSLQLITDVGGRATSVSGEIEILRSREVLIDAIRKVQADLSISVENRFPILGDLFARNYKGKGLAPAFMGLNHFAWGGEELAIAEFVVPEGSYGRKFIVRKAPEGFSLWDVDESTELARGPLNVAVEFEYAGAPGKIAVNRLTANEETRFAISKIPETEAYRLIRANLKVEESSRDSNIIRVSYEHHDIKFAVALVNSIARGYLTQNVERKSAEANQSLAFLDSQLPEIKKEVSRAEDALSAYRTKSQTISVDNAANALLNQAIATEQRKRELLLERQALLQRYRPEHPMVRAVDEQLSALSKEEQRLNAQVDRLPSAQRDLLRLQRDADVSTQLYIGMLNNAQQLRVAKAGTVGTVRVIDYAVADNIPVAPRKPLILAVAAAAGLILGIFSAFLVRMIRPTMRDAAEAEKVSGVPVYAAVPESISQHKLESHHRGRIRPNGKLVSGKLELLATLYPDDPAIESLRSLRTGLTFAMMGAQDKNIVITGATEAIGKSFVSANLSVLLASAGKKVLLIDADLRRPQLGRYFGYHNVEGLSNVLAGTAHLTDVIQRSVVPGVTLDVLPAGVIPPNPGELLLGDAFERTLTTLQQDYELIILDSAPVLPVADTLAVVHHASTVFLVTRAERSTPRELRDAIRKLAGISVMPKGIIFNGVKRNRVGYGYSYKRYYGYGSM